MKTKISEPTIGTITAELSIVKIGNKQMTISVFNQLYSERFWDEEYNILYPVWGKINRDEEYVIFQKGNDLRKCRLPDMKYKECPRFNKDLMFFIKSNKEIVSNKIQQEKTEHTHDDKNPYNILYKFANWSSYSSLTSGDFDLAISVLDAELLNKFKEEFHRRVWLYEKESKMIEGLKNIRQLFISA